MMTTVEGSAFRPLQTPFMSESHIISESNVNIFEWGKTREQDWLGLCRGLVASSLCDPSKKSLM